MTDTQFQVNTDGFDAMIGEQLRALGPAAKLVTIDIAMATEAEVKQNMIPIRDGHAQSTVECNPHPDGMGFTLSAGGMNSKIKDAVDVDYAAALETDLEAHHPNQEGSEGGQRGADFIGRGIKFAGEYGQRVALPRLHDLVLGG